MRTFQNFSNQTKPYQTKFNQTIPYHEFLFYSFLGFFCFLSFIVLEQIQTNSIEASKGAINVYFYMLCLHFRQKFTIYKNTGGALPLPLFHLYTQIFAHCFYFFNFTFMDCLYCFSLWIFLAK